MDFYELVRGPLAWAALCLFFVGCLVRILRMLWEAARDRKDFPDRNLKTGIRSLFHWLIPLGTSGMRRHPALTLVSFVFHVCVILSTLFLVAHSVLWYESWKILLWSLPERVTDTMTAIVILSCVFFLLRRILVPEVRGVSSASDFFFVLLVIVPFLTGFLAYHQWGPYQLLVIAHMLTGEILLVAIPFTRLGHMMVFWFPRAYMGSEYVSIRKLRDW